MLTIESSEVLTVGYRLWVGCVGSTCELSAGASAVNSRLSNSPISSGGGTVRFTAEVISRTVRLDTGQLCASNHSEAGRRDSSRYINAATPEADSPMSTP